MIKKINQDPGQRDTRQNMQVQDTEKDIQDSEQKRDREGVGISVSNVKGAVL